MAATGEVFDAEVADLIARLKAKGINVEEAPTEKVKSPTTSSHTVRLISANEPDVATEATSHRKRKASVAKGSDIKKKRSATSQTPVQQSGRTKKAPAPVMKNEQSTPKVKKEQPIPEESLKGRSVISEMTVEREFLAKFQLVEVSNILIAQGWDHLFREDVLVDDEKVKEFYSKFKLEELRGMPLATFVVGGVEQVFSCRELGGLLDVPARGYGEYTKGIWPESVAKGDVIRRVRGDPNNVSHQGKASTLNLINRILHKLICTSVTPRAQKHEVVNFQDFLLLDNLQGKIQINLPMQILKHMDRAASSKSHGLPFPEIVKKILVKLGIYRPEVECQLSTDLEVQTLASWNWEYVEETGWKNDQYVHAPAVERVPQEVDPLDQRPLDPDEGSPAVIEALRSMSEKVVLLTGKVANLDVLCEKVVKKSVAGGLEELQAKLDALESLPALLREMDESGKINMIHGTRIKEEIKELNRQLRFVGTELVDQLKLLVID